MLDVALKYCLEREVSADYRGALLRVARSMQATGITPLTIEDSEFNDWLTGLGRSATTRSNYRRMGLTLWRYAVEVGMTHQRIGRVKKIKAPVPPPIAWSIDEVRHLLNLASDQRGEFSSGCPKRLFWRAWVLLGYETGIRFRDMHDLRGTALRGRRLTVLQHKTQQPIGKCVSDECAHAIEELIARSPDGTVFKWALSRRWVIMHFKSLTSAAGIAGSTKWLRRSGATAVEAAHPGSAQRFLGHLSPGLAQKHYLDQSLLSDRVPSPPPLTRSNWSPELRAAASSGVSPEPRRAGRLARP